MPRSRQQQTTFVMMLAGLGVSLTVVGISGCDAQSNSVRQAQQPIALPFVAPIVSTEPVSDTQGNTTELEVKDARPVPLQSARVNLKEAQLAVALSQTHLAQARINLIEFQAKHHSTKILSQQGKVSRQQVDTAKAAHQLAQLQHSAAQMEVQACIAQLVAAKAEVSRLGFKEA